MKLESAADSQLEFAIATERDFEEILAISKGIYGGLDYLPSRYHAWIHEPNRTVVLVKKNGVVVRARAKLGWLFSNLPEWNGNRAARISATGGVGVGKRLVGSNMVHWKKGTWPLSQTGGHGAFACPIPASPRGWSWDSQPPSLQGALLHLSVFKRGPESRQATWPYKGN